MIDPRTCAVCGVDLEPRLVPREMRRGEKFVATKVLAIPRHARVRLEWELAWKGNLGAEPAPDDETHALSVCVCAACVGARRIGEVLAVLADRFLEGGQ